MRSPPLHNTAIISAPAVAHGTAAHLRRRRAPRPPQEPHRTEQNQFVNSARGQPRGGGTSNGLDTSPHQVHATTDPAHPRRTVGAAGKSRSAERLIDVPRHEAASGGRISGYQTITRPLHNTAVGAPRLAGAAACGTHKYPRIPQKLRKFCRSHLRGISALAGAAIDKKDLPPAHPVH